MQASPIPAIVIVNGHPATGKTMLARAISKSLQLPLFAKDDLKERLHDALGADGREESQRLGRTAFSLLTHSAEIMLSASKSLVIEGNFDRQHSGPWIAELERRFSPRTIQLFLQATPEVILERVTRRFESGQRHETHMDDIAVRELRERLQTPYEPLEIGGETLVVDTTDFAAVDTAGIVQWVRDRLPSEDSSS